MPWLAGGAAAIFKTFKFLTAKLQPDAESLLTSTAAAAVLLPIRCFNVSEECSDGQETKNRVKTLSFQSAVRGFNLQAKDQTRRATSTEVQQRNQDVFLHVDSFS